MAKIEFKIPKRNTLMTDAPDYLIQPRTLDLITAVHKLMKECPLSSIDTDKDRSGAIFRQMAQASILMRGSSTYETRTSGRDNIMSTVIPVFATADSAKDLNCGSFIMVDPGVFMYSPLLKTSIVQRTPNSLDFYANQGMIIVSYMIKPGTRSLYFTAHQLTMVQKPDDNRSLTNQNSILKNSVLKDTQLIKELMRAEQYARHPRNRKIPLELTTNRYIYKFLDKVGAHVIQYLQFGEKVSKPFLHNIPSLEHVEEIYVETELPENDTLREGDHFQISSQITNDHKNGVFDSTSVLSPLDGIFLVNPVFFSTEEDIRKGTTQSKFSSYDSLKDTYLLKLLRPDKTEKLCITPSSNRGN